MGADLRNTTGLVGRAVSADILVEDQIQRHEHDGVYTYTGRMGETATGDLCWSELAKLDTDWSLVLQDDALPVPDFRRLAAEALAHAPETAVSFYVGTGRPLPMEVGHAVKWAEAVDASWLEATALHWGVAVAMPTAKIEPFLAWTQTGAWGSDAPYDYRIGQFFSRYGTMIRYTWPSLVDHRDGVSLVQPPRDRAPRVAHKIGIPPSWDGPVVKIPARGERLRPIPLSE